MGQNHTMQAIRFHDYGGPDMLVLDQAPVPEPGPDTVLVRIHAAGVNPVDWKLRSGLLREVRPILLPAIAGRDFAGVIEALGPAVTGFMEGQAVYGMAQTGSYAEYALASINEIALKPEKLSFDEAASVPVAGVTAWRALFDVGHLQTGHRVLVQGAAGGVGLFAVQLARWKGAHVIGVASRANAEFVRSLGAEQVIDYRATPVPSAVRDVDVVLDTVGGEVLEQSYGLLRPGGTLVTIAGRANEDKARQHNIRVASPGPATGAAVLLQELAALLRLGKIRAYVQKVLPLEQAGQAQSMSQTGHGRGHVVLHVGD